MESQQNSTNFPMNNGNKCFKTQFEKQKQKESFQFVSVIKYKTKTKPNKATKETKQKGSNQNIPTGQFP